MDHLIKIGLYLGGIIVFLFLISLVKFYFYRKKQIDKVKIIEFIVNTKNTASTYSIHQNVFKNKEISYVTNLLYELESENIINQVKIGNSNNNGLWEYVYKK